MTEGLNYNSSIFLSFSFLFQSKSVLKCRNRTIPAFIRRGIAQLVEQRSPKPRAEGSSPSAPAMKKALARASAFFNDVCPIGQMMLPAVMMYASHMMCLRAWVANIASLFTCEQHHFGDSRNIISRKAATSFKLCYLVVLNRGNRILRKSPRKARFLRQIPFVLFRSTITK